MKDETMSEVKKPVSTVVVYQRVTVTQYDDETVSYRLDSQDGWDGDTETLVTYEELQLQKYAGWAPSDLAEAYWLKVQAEDSGEDL